MAERDDRPKLALLFPGQGSQHAGMGKRVAEISRAAREVFQRADDILRFPLSRLCFEGTEEELKDTVNTQPAVVATSLAYLALLRERLAEASKRLAPSFFAGHSLGQFSAAIAAGSVSLSDGLRVVRERGRIMAEWARTQPGGLAAVLGLDEDQVEAVCQEASPEGDVGVAAVNAPGQTVISGQLAALARAIEIAKQRGARAVRLPISVPGHTPRMRDAANQLAARLAAIRFRDPNPPIVSSITGRILTRGEEVRQELGNQICAAVQWVRCMVTMLDQGTGTFLDVGPGQTLANISRRLTPDRRILSLPELEGSDFGSVAAIEGKTPVAAGAPSDSR